MHDAANILRRYFNQLPEPIIPLEFYERFRQPLRNHQEQAVGLLEAQSPSVGDFDHEAAINAYQSLITLLPPLNRQLLLYILDLLAVFASKSDLNKMTNANLAAIFQPGILSHPTHDMAPQEYRLSQDVLIFLIENQDNFLIGMQGTAADPETVRDVQSGTPIKQPGTPTTPNRSKTVLGRTASNASAGADSVRKWGNIRRNVSVSSKHSKRSEGGPSPFTPSITNPSTPTSGVHRSNTVPSRRAGSAAQSPRFPRDKTSDSPTPSPRAVAAIEQAARRLESVQSTPIATVPPPFPPVALPEVTSASSSEATTPMATVGSDTSSAVRSDYVTPKKDTTPLLAPSSSAEHHAERSPSNAAATSSGHGFLNIFKQSPTSDAEGRRPNKLQKKRIPGSALSSAQSSAQSLHIDGGQDVPIQSPVTPTFPPIAAAAEIEADRTGDHSNYATAQTTPVQATPMQATPQRTQTDTTLRPTTSPTHSYHSTDISADMSDADMAGDDMPREAMEQPEKERKRHRWRFSRSQNKLDQPQTPGPRSDNPLGTMSPREQATSRSTIASSSAGGSQPRRSFQEPGPLPAAITDAYATGTPVSTQRQIQPAATEPVFSDSERERKGVRSWLRGKLQDRKDKEAGKRAKTPERNRDRNESKQDLRMGSEPMPVRGRSLEQQRGGLAHSGQVPHAAAQVSPGTTVVSAQASMPAAQGGTAHGGQAAHAAAQTSPGTKVASGQALMPAFQASPATAVASGQALMPAVQASPATAVVGGQALPTSSGLLIQVPPAQGQAQQPTQSQLPSHDSPASRQMNGHRLSQGQSGDAP